MLVYLEYSFIISGVDIENGVAVDCFSINLVIDYELVIMVREGISDWWIFVYDMSVMALGGCILSMEFYNTHEGYMIAMDI